MNNRKKTMLSTIWTGANNPLTGKEREHPQKEPGIPDTDKPTIPDLPDENPNPTLPKPDINEPEINDPTRTDELPPIFNNK